MSAKTAAVRTVWHKLLHESGRTAWAMNVRIVRSACFNEAACPGKVSLLRGSVNQRLLWYLPQDVKKTVIITNPGGWVDTYLGCQECDRCGHRGWCGVPHK